MSAFTVRSFAITIKGIPCDCTFKFQLKFFADGTDPVCGGLGEHAEYTEAPSTVSVPVRMKVLEGYEPKTFDLYFNLKGKFDLVINYIPSTDSWAAADSIFRNGKIHDICADNYDGKLHTIRVMTVVETETSVPPPQQHVLETVDVDYLCFSYDEGEEDDAD
jgi:hypothetical protein